MSIQKGGLGEGEFEGIKSEGDKALSENTLIWSEARRPQRRPKLRQECGRQRPTSVREISLAIFVNRQRGHMFGPPCNKSAAIGNQRVSLRNTLPLYLSAASRSLQKVHVFSQH
jgi:hypothetical protein